MISLEREFSMPTFTIVTRYIRSLLTSLAAVAFRDIRQLAESGTADRVKFDDATTMRSIIASKESPMKTIATAARYVRYLVTSLAAVAFGLTYN